MARATQTRAKGYIRPQEARYIELTLQSIAPTAKKQALQRLCKLYRSGLRLSAPMVIKGLIIQNLRDRDSKVKRWAFNALSQLGTGTDVTLMMPALDEYRSVPEIFEAGVTALAHLLPKDEVAAALAQWGVTMDPETIFALAQQSNDYDAELADVRLDIDLATTQQLRAGTLLVGLQRAPEGLFSMHHPVTEVIGALNKHSDPIVAQYSFWAAVEHPRLGVDQMRVPPKDFLSLPPNVQGWALRVLTKDAERTRDNYDLVIAASESEHLETREGLAFGIRDIYYDSLDISVIDWYIEEEEVVVKERLLEHMSAQASESSGYRTHAELAFRASAPGSTLRARLEAACRDDTLALTFRKIELQTGDPDLFAAISGGNVTNNNNQTFNGQNFAGISNSGTGNSGDIKIFGMVEAQQQIVPVLNRLKDEIQAQHSEYATAANTAEGTALIDAAIKEPTRQKVEGVLKWLRLADKGGRALAGLAKSADTISTELHHFLPHLPHIF